MRIRAAIDEHTLALAQAGRSRRTIEQYAYHLDRLAVWLDGEGVEDLALVSRSLLRRWGAGLREAWAPSTIRQAVYAVRSLWRFAVAEGWQEEDVSAALVVPRVPRRPQRTLTVEELSQLLAACDESLVGVRNRALVGLLVDSGLRASEVCELAVGDVALEVGTLTVEVKGGDVAYGFFGQRVARWLGEWLLVRPAAPGVRTVFVGVGGSTPGQPMTPAGLRCVLRQLGERAGVARVSPHAFRRSFATISTTAGAPGRVMQLAGRWSNIQMVERYTWSLEALAAGQVYREQWAPMDRLLVDDS